MAKFYRMTADTNLEDIVKPGEEILSLSSACRASEFQFLNHKSLTVAIAEDSGLTFPDFLCNDGIPLISPAFKRILDSAGVDNLFYKPIYLDYKPLGKHEPYIMALPPRIRAVRREYMRLVDEDGDESEEKELIKDEYGIARYKINASAVGNYRIFKLADVWDTDIIVTDDLMKMISEAQMSNVFFAEIEED